MRTGWIAALATVLVAASPAAAERYIGTLFGTVTAGGWTHVAFHPISTSGDLTGAPIQIDFRAVRRENYVVNGDLYPDYLLTEVRVQLPTLTPLLADLKDLTSQVKPDDWVGFSEFMGDENAGNLRHYGGQFSGSFLQNIIFNYSGASSTLGAISGSGTAQAANCCNEYDSSWNAEFTLDSGKVSVSAVPEPATWALMIGGVGATGGLMRRRRFKEALA